MKVFLGRVSTIVALVAVGGLAIARTILDVIGYATIPEDTKVAQGLAERFLFWLLSLPLWLPWIFAAGAVLGLLWFSWPRRAHASTAVDSAAKLRSAQQIKTPAKSSAPKRFVSAKDKGRIATAAFQMFNILNTSGEAVCDEASRLANWRHITGTSGSILYAAELSLLSQSLGKPSVELYEIYKENQFYAEEFDFVFEHPALGPALSEAVQALINALKGVPEQPKAETIELLATYGDALQRLVGDYHNWVRGTKQQLQALRTKLMKA